MTAPDAAARCSGAAEPAVLRPASAPAASSTRTVRSSPEPAASDSAVSPARLSTDSDVRALSVQALTSQHASGCAQRVSHNICKQPSSSAAQSGFVTLSRGTKAILTSLQYGKRPLTIGLQHG